MAIGQLYAMQLRPTAESGRENTSSPKLFVYISQQRETTEVYLQQFIITETAEEEQLEYHFLPVFHRKIPEVQGLLHTDMLLIDNNALDFGTFSIYLRSLANKHSTQSKSMNAICTIFVIWQGENYHLSIVLQKGLVPSISRLYILGTKRQSSYS